MQYLNDLEEPKIAEVPKQSRVRYVVDLVDTLKRVTPCPSLALP